MKTIAIYHKDCTDGTTAAAIVLRKYPDAILYPLGHNYEAHELATIVASAEKGDRILTVDCIIGVKEFLSAGYSVTSIDHHVSVEADYKKLASENPAFTFVFDITHSGAGLTWKYLFPNEEVPELVKLVEDRDIWNWKYSPDTDNVTNRLWLYDNDPKKILELMGQPLDGLKQEGAIISAYTNALMEQVIKKVEPITLKLGDYKVLFFNITMFKSEIGHMLCEQHRGAVALYTIDKDQLKISFRSADGHKPTALDVAKTIGGGGHENAAGGRMTLEQFYKSRQSDSSPE